MRQFLMQSDDAPPNFWRAPGEATALVDGVELESAVPTRFFQTLDAYPSEWGRLVWRIQLNRLVAECVASPVLRTFYPGVEWNLRRPDVQPDDRWFLTAWMRWEGTGPPHYDLADAQPTVRIEANTALFLIAPNLEQPLFLRSRVDARDRRQIAQALDPEAQPPKGAQGVILLDDLIERH